FPKTVFPAVSFNLGPQTVTWPHKDFHNLAWGWCSVTALGDFNPDKGGHLVLWDIGLIIRFPPGSTILLPSALLTHSNVPIEEGETRYSVVQYASEGLFRWVYNSFRSNTEFAKTATAEEKVQQERDEKTRWANAVDMFWTWKELQSKYGQ
ncbi:hypothetical protein F5880DRAFT_1489312, partial [Lentinula raphanica]